MGQMNLQQNHKNNNNTEMCCDSSCDSALEKIKSMGIIKAIHPDKPIKDGDCPICRGDKIVKVLTPDGKEHFDSCVCCKDKVTIQRILRTIERIQKLQKENEMQEKAKQAKQKPEEIQWTAFHPNRPIEEGQCPICGGEGMLRAFVNGYEYMKNCVCTERQVAMQRIKNSGLAEILEKSTFDSFQTPEEWQKRLKQKALQFLEEKGKWFFVGGQVGCGKTHICTAICAEFIKRGISVQYIIWVNEIVKLKANKMDDEAYQKLISPLLTAPVLYIDDLFKTEKGKRPSEADIRTAFEIINYRYVNSKLITIFSTEKTVDDLIEIDEAVGSRIHEKTKGYRNVILEEENRNWRLKKEK